MRGNDSATTFGIVRQCGWEDLERDRQPDHLEVLVHVVGKGTPLSYSRAGERLKNTRCRSHLELMTGP